MSTYRKIQVVTLSTDFRSATQIVTVPLPTTLKDGHVLARLHYAGINASDINFTSGKYFPNAKPPFDVGFEAVGSVTAVGAGVTLKIGAPVLISAYGGAFGEYIEIEENRVVPLPSLSPVSLTLIASGMTAEIALRKVGELKSNETVLITAAAGGTGHFAVQLAKLAGNHVIGTCSNNEKVNFLKSIGCDRVINRTEEELDDVLKKEYPKGIDIVYESVGGTTFDTCVRHLAVNGKLIIIGMISGYKDGSAWKSKESDTPIWEILLSRSASIRGFFLGTFQSERKESITKLMGLIESGKLVAHLDSTHFHGLESIPDAIDHMYSGRNIGKVYVKLCDDHHHGSKEHDHHSHSHSHSHESEKVKE